MSRTPFASIILSRVPVIANGMKKYVEASARQYEAEEQLFVQLLNESHMHEWQPEQPLVSDKNRLLIGACTWNGYDLQLLDHIEESAHLWDSKFQVDVFNFDRECKCQADLEKYIPGIGPISYMFAVGLWVSGELTQTASGPIGRDFAQETLGLETVRFPTLGLAKLRQTRNGQ